MIASTRCLRAALFALPALFGSLTFSTLRAQDEKVTLPAVESEGSFLDRLPSYVADRLPMLDPDGSVQAQVKPHIGDFFHKGYIRIPVGLRWTATPNFELSTEVNSYFPHDNGATRDGLSGVDIGAKYRHVLQLDEGDVGAGIDYRLPFAHTPTVLTDGYKHLQPFIAYARPLHVYQLLGYANFGANFFEHTSLPSNFGRNQLHANSLNFAVGAARDWGRIRATLTARIASTELMSDEGRQNFQLRPEVSLPLRRNPNARTQIMLTLGGRVMWGPDGRQMNTNGGFRVNFRLDRERERRANPDALAQLPM